MILILVFAGLSFKDWRKVIPFFVVLIVSYLVGISFAIYTKAEFNLQTIRFIVLSIVFLIASIKMFKFENRYLNFKKEYLILLLVALFSFLNGLGSASNFILELDVYYYKLIPVIEVFSGFSLAVFLIALLQLVINTIIHKFSQKSEVKLNTLISIIIICMSFSLIFKEILL